MTGRDIIADCDDSLKTILAKMTLNKPFINSYLASSISVEAKYYFLIHFINFRNKRPNKNLKWQNLIFGFLPTLNKPFIKSYFASSISGEVKNNLLTHLITFRNKNPKWQNLNFWVFANPGHHNLPLYPFLSLSAKLFFKMSPNLLIDSTKSLVLMVDEKKLTFLSFLETNLFVMRIMKKIKKFFASKC